MARRTKRKTTKRRRSKTTRRLPQGFTRVGKSYALVFGTKSKPKLGKKRFSKRTTLKKYVMKTYGKKKRR